MAAPDPDAVGRRTWLSTLGIVSGGHMLSHLYILAYPPLFPFLIDDFGLNNTQIGAIMSVVALSTFVLQTPVGELVDRVGAKRVFVLGVLFTGGGTALVGFADSYLLILVFAGIAGIGQAAFHPADYALLDAVTAGRGEGKSFSVHTFAGYVGFAAAPALVGGIAVVAGWQTALFAVGGFGVAYAVFCQFALRPVYRERAAALQAQREAGEDADAEDAVVDEAGEEASADDGLTASLATLTHPTILAMFLFFVVITMANKGFQTFTTVFVVERLSLTAVVGNTALTGYFVLAAGGVLVGGVLADRYDVKSIIVATLSVAALVTWFTASGVMATSLSAIALFSSVGFFYGVALPARDRLINTVSTAESTGKSFGFVYTGLPLGGFVAPALLGAIIDYTGAPTVAFVLVGTFYVGAAAVIAWLALSQLRARDAPLFSALRR